MAGKAGQLNLNINKFASFECNLTWKVSSNGAAIDVSGYQALLQVRPSHDSPAVLFEMSTSNGRIELGTTNGRIKLLLPATITAEIRWDKGFYDLLMKAPNNTIRRIIEGEITVHSGVSRFPG